MPSESLATIKCKTILPSTRKRRTERQRFFPKLLRAALLFSVFLVALPASADYSPLPQPAPLPHFNPLCDSNLVPCLDIDKYALHVYAHLMVLPRTELRDTAAAFPYGVTLGVLGRFAGGVSIQSSFWQQSDGLQRAQGPLRLSLTALLWPLFPLSQAPMASRRSPETKHLDTKVDKRTDSYPQKRGREQIIHDLYEPPMNKINPISPQNPKRQQYLDAAKKLQAKTK